MARGMPPAEILAAILLRAVSGSGQTLGCVLIRLGRAVRCPGWRGAACMIIRLNYHTSRGGSPNGAGHYQHVR
jgi:hypothetical protein